jgi:hypothetical protein
MDTSASFISMPVVRVDSDRNNDEQSKKEKQRQLERQLPRMRTIEKSSSERMLAHAMQAGITKASAQEFSALPRPATIKNPPSEDGLTHKSRSRGDVDRSLVGEADLNQPPTNKDILNNRPIEKDSSFRQKEVNVQEMGELHALEEMLSSRVNPPSTSDILNMLKSIDRKIKNDQALGIKSSLDAAEQEEIICSLDFLDGYVSASAEIPVIHAEVMGMIESLRQKITSHRVEIGANIIHQPEHSVQLLGGSETRYLVQQDTLGHQKVVIEASESTMQKIVSLPRRSEEKDAALNRTGKPGDDTLPLAVQRSV